MVSYRAQNAVWIALFAIILCFSIAQTALAAAAPGIAPTPCDVNYYNSLKSRAWLEAQREITQNQNLIYKPDSVLEYTCFDRYMSVLAANTQTMFSETTRWNSTAPTNMADALNALVGGTLTNYIAANFSHEFLGGRLRARTVNNQTFQAMNYTPQAVTRNANYTCDNMANVWAQAKCIDFVDTVEEDAFFTFEDYRDQPDKRFLPTRCDNENLPDQWENEINLASVDDFTPWTENDILTYFDLLDPANCANSLQIPTGVLVIRSKQAPVRYNEKVCIAAGCRYVPSGLNNGTCVSGN